jgi:hypothetical protein
MHLAVALMEQELPCIDGTNTSAIIWLASFVSSLLPVEEASSLPGDVQRCLTLARGLQGRIPELASLLPAADMFRVLGVVRTGQSEGGTAVVTAVNSVVPPLVRPLPEPPTTSPLAWFLFIDSQSQPAHPVTGRILAINNPAAAAILLSVNEIAQYTQSKDAGVKAIVKLVPDIQVRVLLRGLCQQIDGYCLLAGIKSSSK